MDPTPHKDPETRRTVKIGGVPVTLTPLGAAIFMHETMHAFEDEDPQLYTVSLPVWLDTPGKPGALAKIFLGRDPRCSEILHSQAKGVEALEEEVAAHRQLIEEIRTLLTARGYHVGDLPDFLIPLALASIVPERPPERPKEEVKHRA